MLVLVTRFKLTPLIYCILIWNCCVPVAGIEGSSCTNILKHYIGYVSGLDSCLVVTARAGAIKKYFLLFLLRKTSAFGLNWRRLLVRSPLFHPGLWLLFHVLPLSHVKLSCSIVILLLGYLFIYLMYKWTPLFPPTDPAITIPRL